MKNRAEVVIAGTRIILMGEQEEEYMHKIGELVDQKVSEFRQRGVNTTQKAVCLAACDMADSYVQAVKSADHIRQQMGEYLEENSNLNKKLADANLEIAAMEKRAQEKAEEISHIDQLKERIISLEQQVAGEDKRRARIEELESQLTQCDLRIRSFQDDADKRARRIKDLEHSLAQSESVHRSDMEEAEKRERYIRELKDQLSDAEKQRRRIEELEKALADTERQLNDVRSRLARMLK